MSGGGGWRGFVHENLEVLSKCTAVTSEMVTVLFRDRLISPSEKDKFMSPSISGHDRATTLYIEISRKWGDEGFEKFKEALKEGGNTRALEILNEIPVEQNIFINPPVPSVDPSYEMNKPMENLVQLQMSTEQKHSSIDEQTPRSLRKLDTDTSARFSTIENTCGILRLATEEQFTAIMRKLVEVERKEEATQESVKLLQNTLKIFETENQQLQTEVTRLKENSEQEEVKLAELRLWTQDMDAAILGWLEELEIKVDLQFRLNRVDTALQIWKLRRKNVTKQPTSQMNEMRLSIAKSQQVAVGYPISSATIEWDLGETLSAFEVKKATGSWFRIEQFSDSGLTQSSTRMCQEYVFKVTGTTVEKTNRWRNSGQMNEYKFELSVDTVSPHQWIYADGYVKTWVKTDYKNWGLLMTCYKELLSCRTLFILSRERNLPPRTLEMLRDVAEKHGFPNANGCLVNQSSC